MKTAEQALPFHERVRLVRIRTFFGGAFGSMFALVIAGLFLVLMLHDAGIAAPRLIVWQLVLILACTGVYAFECHVKRVGIGPENARQFFRRRALLGLLTSSLFGGSVFLLLPQSSSTTYVIVFPIVSSILVTAHMAYATAYTYCLAIHAVTLLPFTAHCFYRYARGEGRFFLLFGLLAVVWELLVAGKALQMSRAVVGEIEARERLHDEMAERRQAEEAQRESQDEAQRLATLLRMMCDNVPDMIWAKDRENRYLFANVALCERLLMAEDTQEPVGKTFEYFAQRQRAAHAGEADWHSFGQFSQDVDQHTMSRNEPTVFEECGNVGGRLVYLDVHQAPFVDAQGEVIGTVGSARDITERKATELFVQHLAHHDVLTDLPNRALLSDRLTQALAHIRRDRLKLALLFIDLDRLKPVNDTLGHDVGDVLLREVANRLRTVVARDSDTVARLGGDEFVVLLSRINRVADAELVARNILSALSRPFLIRPHTIDISASIGIAVAPLHGSEVGDLLRRADAAMYVAKNGGRNAYRLFDASMEVAGDDGS